MENSISVIYAIGFGCLYQILFGPLAPGIVYLVMVATYLLLKEAGRE